MKIRFVAGLVKVSVCFVLLACDQKAPQQPTSTAAPPPQSLEAALRIGSQHAMNASVVHSKRTGFPLEDSHVAQMALAKELATAQPRDAVIAALSDLLLQAEKNNRYKGPLELRSKVFDPLVRIHRTDQFPTDVVATSVLGFYENEEAVSVLDETARNTESARFKASALA